MDEALNAAERANSIAEAVGPWALLIIVAVAEAWVIWWLARMVIACMREQVTQNSEHARAMEVAAAVSERSAQAADRCATALVELRSVVDQMRGTVERCKS